MGDLRDLLRAALEDDDDKTGLHAEMKKVHAQTFGKVRTKHVYDAAIEWTCHEFFHYAMSVLNHKEENLEAAKKVGRLISELRDTLIQHGEYDSTKMPNINYFHALNGCKEPE